jgi:glycerophosphoryl diester phosphodiesterase
MTGQGVTITRTIAVMIAAAMLATGPAAIVGSPAAASAACPQLVAHQGYSGAVSGDGPVPDNSVASMRLAVHDGARVAEFDVRFSADHRPVVIHNATVNMTTRYSGPVADYRAVTLERMHLVSPWNSDHATADTLPSLSAMVTEARTLAVPVVIEIKTPGIDQADAAAFMAAIGSYAPRTDVHSFYVADLALLPGLTRTLLSLSATTAIPAGYAGADFRASQMTATLAVQLHRLSLTVGAYTTPGSGMPDDTASWSKLAADGVNRIITNNTPGYVTWLRKGCPA